MLVRLLMLTGRFFPAKSVSTLRMTLLAERVAAEGGQVLVLSGSEMHGWVLLRTTGRSSVTVTVAPPTELSTDPNFSTKI